MTGYFLEFTLSLTPVIDHPIVSRCMTPYLPVSYSLLHSMCPARAQFTSFLKASIGACLQEMVKLHALECDGICRIFKIVQILLLVLNITIANYHIAICSQLTI